MRLSVNRLFAALPDAITAGVYVTAWIDPSIVGAAAITNLMLTMLIEFFVVHSGGFYAGIAAAEDVGRGKRLLMWSGLTAMYMVFILAFAKVFDSTWPIFAFGWLFLCRFFHLWMRPAQAARETESQLGLWAASVAAYVLGGVATVALPLPALGITPEFIATMQLPGRGEWVERPYTVLAFGTLYFAVQAFAKYKATPAAAARMPQKATPA